MYTMIEHDLGNGPRLVSGLGREPEPLGSDPYYDLADELETDSLYDVVHREALESEFIKIHERCGSSFKFHWRLISGVDTGYVQTHTVLLPLKTKMLDAVIANELMDGLYVT